MGFGLALTLRNTKNCVIKGIDPTEPLDPTEGEKAYNSLDKPSRSIRNQTRRTKTSLLTRPGDSTILIDRSRKNVQLDYSIAKKGLVLA